MRVFLLFAAIICLIGLAASLPTVQDTSDDVQIGTKWWWHSHHRHHPHRHTPHRHHHHTPHSHHRHTPAPSAVPTPAPFAEVPCHGSYFQCFQERASHGHRLSAIGSACSDLVRELSRHTSATLGCSHWYSTLTLAAGTAQLAQLRRDIPLNWVRPRGGSTIALESSFAACGSWGVGRGSPIDRLMSYVLPARCFTPTPTPSPTHTPTEYPTTLPPTTDEPSFEPTHTPTE